MRHGLAARRTPLAFVNTFAGSCGVCNIIGPHARGRDESKAQAVSGQLILKWALDGSSRMAWMCVGNQSESQAPHKPEKQPLCTLIRIASESLMLVRSQYQAEKI